MKIKTTRKYHLTPVKVATIKKTTIKSVGEDVKKREPSCTAGGNVNWCSHCGKQYRVSSKKLKIKLPYDPAILILSTYPKKMKALT